MLGFQYHGIHRGKKKGGGVGFLISDNLIFRDCPSHNIMKDHLEACTIELKLNKTRLLLTSMYRPPNTDVSYFIEDYTKLIMWLKSTRSEFLIGTDHNLDLLKYESHKPTMLFMETLIEQELFPCMTCPT